MTVVDWVALGLVLLAALGGAVQGFVWSGLSLAGLLAGAFLGGRLVPVLLANGSRSHYAPVVALVAAVAFAVAFEVVGSTIGSLIRSRERARGVRAADSAGGVVAGALIGFAVVWVLGAMALQLPGQADLRRAVQRSYVLQRLNEIVPPRSLLNALARIDPFPSFAGPPVPTEPPDPRVLRKPGVRAAAPSVVRVLGTACGLGVEGSGWVVADGLVVTAAHVVAGEEDTEVVPLERRRAEGADRRVRPAQRRGGAARRRPRRAAVAAEGPTPGRGDRDRRLPAQRAARGERRPDRRDRDGARPGRVRRRPDPPCRDEPGRDGRARQLRRPGGGRLGAVQSTVFAARATGSGGYGVPASVVRRDVASAGGPVATGPCVR